MGGEKHRKGFYFSFDALIAVSLMVLGFMLFTTIDISQDPIEVQRSSYKRASKVGQDSLELMSKQNLNTLSNSTVSDLIENSSLTKKDLNKSVVDNIALLWASENYTQARKLSRDYLDRLISDKYEYRLRIGEDSDKIIYNSSYFDENVNLITEASRLVSGYKKTMPSEGYVSRASLSEVTKKDSEYFYFGGFEGDGVLKKEVTLPEFEEISNFSMEMDVRSNFTLYLNSSYFYNKH